MSKSDVVVALESSPEMAHESAGYLQIWLLWEFGQRVSLGMIEAARQRYFDLWPENAPQWMQVNTVRHDGER